MIEWVNLGEKLLIHNTDGQRVLRLGRAEKYYPLNLIRNYINY